MGTVCVAEAGVREIGALLPGHYGADGMGTVIQAASISTVWNVQGDPARTSIVADVQRWFDVPLPVVPDTAWRAPASALLALWIGPRSWLLIEGGLRGHRAALVDLDARRDALNIGGGALFDVSASRVAYTIRGPRAATVLARCCPLDFDPRVFLPGDCAQSVFGRVSALYYRHERTPAFTVMVARSLAAAVWRSLCVAAATDGYDVALPGAFDPG